MERVWAIALCVTACGRVGFDTELGDAGTAPCAMPVLSDSFDTDPPCGSWGSVANSTGTVTVSGGQLVIAPNPNTSSTQDGCVTNSMMPFGASGVFVQTSTTAGSGEFKVVDLSWATYVTEIAWSNTLSFLRIDTTNAAHTAIGAIAFDPTTTRWARMRPTPDGSGMIAEYSVDGRTWQQLAVDPIAAPLTVNVEIYGGMTAAEASPAAVVFDGFDTCP